MAEAKRVAALMPKKAGRAFMRAARFLHLPQMYDFARRNIMRIVDVLGAKAFITYMLTSTSGQKVLKTAIAISKKLIEKAVTLAWWVLTSPLRLFKRGREWLKTAENKVGAANKRLTPNSGTTYGALQLAHEVGAWAIDPKSIGIRAIRHLAAMKMGINVVRRFTPPGILRGALTLVSLVLGVWSFKAQTDAAKTAANDPAVKAVGKGLRKRPSTVEAGTKKAANEVRKEAGEALKTSARKGAASSRKKATETRARGRKQAAAVEAEAQRLDGAATEQEQIAEQVEAGQKTEAEVAATQTANEGNEGSGAAPSSEPAGPSQPATSPAGPSVPPEAGGKVAPAPVKGSPTKPTPVRSGTPRSSGGGSH
jgi:hypothetical protein